MRKNIILDGIIVFLIIAIAALLMLLGAMIYEEFDNETYQENVVSVAVPLSNGIDYDTIRSIVGTEVAVCCSGNEPGICPSNTPEATRTAWITAETWTPSASVTHTMVRSPTPFSTRSWTPTGSPYPTLTVTRMEPSRTPVTPSPTASPMDTRSPTPRNSPTRPVSTPTITATVAPSETVVSPTSTLQPSSTPTLQPSTTRTRTPISSPTATATYTAEPCVCYQWICHRLGDGQYQNESTYCRPTPKPARWKNYCCWSDGCVRAKLKQGDLLGRCEDHGIVPSEPDEWNREGCP